MEFGHVHSLQETLREERPELWPHKGYKGLNCSHRSLGQVSKSVREMASLSCGYNISLDELDRACVYWQKDGKMVLAIISGMVKVWPEYKNRTFSDIANNLSLVILGLHLSDGGTYTCVVQRSDRGPYRGEHLKSVMLSIRADFPVPVITELEDPFPDIKRIMCSTTGGFPQPRLSWWENGTVLTDINTTISQDPETKLYNVTSEMDFNATYNHSIVCHVEYGDSEVLKNFTWEKRKQHYLGKCLLYGT
ncbi:T-lymphocyte activation antigen CD80-like [Nannospalax galili]|uniref:T-lymphocyte activation antigen CD80-like n=1 Tax=Nannospalax galili TaxID=1026970 RepID=UPI00111C283A|nr:T-lymphocyte activation antigen CD80-like [Nannospalax galili]